MASGSLNFPAHSANPWRTKLCHSIAEVDQAEWNQLSRGYAVLRHEFLLVLETSGVVGAERGVKPVYLTVRDAQGVLRAAAPAMVKVNTIGEAGPEWRWLRAAEQLGWSVMPKWQVDVAFMPVMTPKLLTDGSRDSDDLRKTLLALMHQKALLRPQGGGFSVLRIIPEEAAMLQSLGFLISHEVHSRWHNPGHPSYEAYIRALPERKRYQVRKERRAASRTGLEFRFLTGKDVTGAVWDDFYEGHLRVCQRHRVRPWMTSQFFHQVAIAMPEAVVLLGAFKGTQYVAGIFCLLDRDSLCMRNWSVLGDASQITFELLCHLPIEWAISNGITTLESGLAAVHKTHRGFTTEMVPNAHWIPDERLRQLAAGINDAHLSAISDEGAVPVTR